MEKDSFSPTQIESLRIALGSYKKSQKLNWLQIAENIIWSSTNNFDFPDIDGETSNDIYLFDEVSIKSKKRDAGWPIQAKTIIRFVEGIPNKKTGTRDIYNVSRPKLITFRDFLIEEGYLASYDANNVSDEVEFVTISEFLNFFAIPANYLEKAAQLDLTGDYQIQVDDMAERYTQTLRTIRDPNESLYKLEETIVSFKPSTKIVIAEENYTGVAFFTSKSTLIGLIRNSNHKFDGKRNRIYVFRQIEDSNNFATALHIDSIVHSLSFSDKNSESNSPYKALIFGRYPDFIRHKSTKDAKVVDMFGRKKPDITTFSDSKKVAHPWQQYQEKLKANNKKDDNLEKDELNKKFLETASKGQFWLLDDLIERGADINYRNEFGQCALHLTALYKAKPAIHELIKHKDLKYWVTDDQGRLPGHYAGTGSFTPELVRFFIKKQIEEAKALGLSDDEIKQPSPFVPSVE